MSVPGNSLRAFPGGIVESQATKTDKVDKTSRQDGVSCFVISRFCAATVCVGLFSSCVQLVVCVRACVCVAMFFFIRRRGHFVLTHAWADSGAALLLLPPPPFSLSLTFFSLSLSPGRHVFQVHNSNDYREPCSRRCSQFAKRQSLRKFCDF